MNFELNIGGFKLSLGKGSAETKSTLSPEMSAWINAEDVGGEDRGAKLVTPYAQSTWVYIAITRLAEKLSQIPFRISKVSGGKARKVRTLLASADPRARRFCRRALSETVLDSGAVVDLFNRPHPTMSRELFWEMLVTWWALRGEFFILPLDRMDSPVDLTDRNPRIAGLITLPTELFWHIVVGYELEAWRYTGSPLLTPIPSEILLPSQVIHTRSPNPYLYWRGMSPLVVAMVSAGADYAASQYSKGYWLNNADTGVIVTTDQSPTAEQRAEILAALRERKRKAGTADRPMFLWGGSKVEKPMLSGMESTFIENRKMNRQEIAAIYKVPDSIMGFSEAKASALSGGGNALEQDQLSFIENTIWPIGCQCESALAPVVMTFGDDLVGWFDYDALPVMQSARRGRLDAGAKAFAMGVPFNDINKAYDLGFPEYPWGKQGYLPFNLQPAGEPEQLPSENPDDQDQDKEKEDAEKSSPFERMRKLLSAPQPATAAEGPASLSSGERAGVRANLEALWLSHVRARRKSIAVIRSKTAKVLFDFRAKTLAKLDHIHLQDSLNQKSQIKNQKSLIDLIFDPHAFGASLLNALQNPLVEIMGIAGQELRDEIGSDDPWETPPQAAKDYLAKRDIPIKGVGGTVRDQLNTSLQEGLDNGETHSQLSDRIKSVFTNLTKYEADRVARTEVNVAYNDARHLSMADAGIEYKAWLSSHGPNVRDAHAQAEEDYIDEPIPIDDPFIVDGEELMYPGDPNGSSGNTINCQCINIAAQKKSEDAASVTYLVVGMGLLTFARKS